MKGTSGTMKKLCGKKSRFILGVVLFFLLSANLLYWGSRKEGYFCDELYSYHFTHQLEHPYITADREDGTWLDNWHPAEYFRDYLTLTKEEAFDFAGVWKTIRADVHPPFFYLLLAASSSIFTTVFPGIFTKWSGILVNIAFLMATLFFLWKLARELTESDFWSAVACILYGFSAGAASTVVFIRMYTVFTCFAVLFTYLNVLLWKTVRTKDGKKSGWLYPLLSLAAVLGILNQYYFLIYAFFICVIIWGYALWKRNYFFALKYALAMATGIALSCLVWPEILNDIFSGYRGEEAFDNLTAGGEWLDAVPDLWAVIDGELFGKGALLLLIFAAGLAACRFLSIWWRVERHLSEDGSMHLLFEKRNPCKKMELQFEVRDLIFVQILTAVFFYLVLISKIAPYLEDRYIFPVYPMIVLLVVMAARKLVAGMPKGITAVVCTVLFACMLLGYLSPGVNYLYRGTENKLQTVSMYSDLPVFYVTSGSSYRACGESVYFSKAERTYPVRGELIGTIPEALAGLEDEEGSGHRNESRCLVYIDLNYEDYELMAQDIGNMFPDGQMRWLFDTEYSAVYIVE